MKKHTQDNNRFKKMTNINDKNDNQQRIKPSKKNQKELVNQVLPIFLINLD